MQAIAQEHISGCGIACAAYKLGVSYAEVFRRLNKPTAGLTGIFCEDLCNLLPKTIWFEFNGEKLLDGDIVYISSNDRYPTGHWQVRCANLWMNSWINFPSIIPVISGFEKYLSGNIKYIVRNV